MMDEEIVDLVETLVSRTVENCASNSDTSQLIPGDNFDRMAPSTSQNRAESSQPRNSVKNSTSMCSVFCFCSPSLRQSGA